jgi:transposase
VTEEVDHSPGRSEALSGFQEVTIIAGTARRRRYSQDEKMRIVAESLDPAVSVSAVARRHGINPNQLFFWRKQLRETALNEGAACPAACAEGLAEASDLIELVVAGVTVRVRSGVDGAALRRVLAALRAAR